MFLQVEVEALDRTLTAFVTAVLAKPQASPSSDVKAKPCESSEEHEYGQVETAIDVRLGRPIELSVSKGEQSPLPGKYGDLPIRLYRYVCCACARAHVDTHVRMHCASARAHAPSGLWD